MVKMSIKGNRCMIFNLKEIHKKFQLSITRLLIISLRNLRAEID